MTKASGADRSGAEETGTEGRTPPAGKTILYKAGGAAVWTAHDALEAASADCAACDAEHLAAQNGRAKARARFDHTKAAPEFEALEAATTAAEEASARLAAARAVESKAAATLAEAEREAARKGLPEIDARFEDSLGEVRLAVGELVALPALYLAALIMLSEAMRKRKQLGEERYQMHKALGVASERASDRAAAAELGVLHSRARAADPRLLTIEGETVIHGPTAARRKRGPHTPADALRAAFDGELFAEPVGAVVTLPRPVRGSSKLRVRSRTTNEHLVAGHRIGPAWKIIEAPGSQAHYDALFTNPVIEVEHAADDEERASKVRTIGSLEPDRGRGSFY